MAPIIYKADLSPACRAVLMTIKALELEVEFKEIDMTNKDHHAPEFVEINPQHTIPVIDDDGYILTDSHAIITYLCSKYGADDSLYPADLQQRGLVDQRLYFDSGSLQPLLRVIVKLVLFEGCTSIPERIVDGVNEAYGFLEAFLQDKEWFAGDSATLADITLIATLTSMNIIIPIDSDSFPKLSEWLGRVEELPFYEENAGLQIFKDVYETFMG